eukprot:TRINITY_DN5414_c0_g1_i7.p1 TRINITY_DN5414_c0_g1~~TRINITY_DN5414_c0_g1_i7.p1  ORF type:complete len:385 (-),score=110.10 TRINITY_DN5414_c0_g1_i7:95-1249(-)
MLKQDTTTMTPQQLTSHISSIKNSIETLKEKSEDLIATFLINKQLFDIAVEKYCANSPHKSHANVKALMSKLKECEETCSTFFKQNFALNEEILGYKNEIEDMQYIHRVEINELEIKNSALAELWSDKEKQIAVLREKLESGQRKSSRALVKEKNIIRPTRETLVFHNELEINKGVAEKFTKKMVKEKAKRSVLIDYTTKLKARNDKLKSALDGIISSSKNSVKKPLSPAELEALKALTEDGIEEPIVLTEQLERGRRADTSINMPQKSEETEPLSTSFMGSHKTTVDKSEEKSKRPVPTLNLGRLRVYNNRGKVEEGKAAPGLQIIEKHPEAIVQSPPVTKKTPHPTLHEEKSSPAEDKPGKSSNLAFSQVKRLQGKKAVKQV